jgi:ligand-binding sensor domain-containing protein
MLEGQRYLYFESYGPQKGLFFTDIKGLVQDPKGFLWLSTKDNGVVRYDGKEGLVINGNAENAYNLKGFYTYEPTISSDGQLVLPSNVGLNVFNLKTQKFELAQFPYDKAVEQCLTFTESSFFDFTNTLWMSPGGNQGLIALQGPLAKGQHIKPSVLLKDTVRTGLNTIMTSLKDRDGIHIWLGSTAGLMRFNPKTGSIELFFQHPGDQQLLQGNIHEKANHIISIHQDDDGSLWWGTWGGGLLHFDPKSKAVECFLFEAIQPITGNRNYVGDIEALSADELWLATSGGLAIFDKRSKTYSFVKDSPQYCNIIPEGVNGFYRGQNGTLWMTSHINGLYAFHQKQQMLDYNLLPEPIFKAQQNPYNPNHILASPYGKTPSFYESFDGGKTFKKQSATANLANNFNFIRGFLFAPDGQIWLYETNGLYTYKNGQIKYYNAGKEASTDIYEASLDHENNIWIANRKGLFKVDLKTQSTQSFKGNGAAECDWFYNVFNDSQNRTWYVGGKYFGYYDHASRRFSNFSHQDLKVGEDLKFNLYFTIAEDLKGNIWIGDGNVGLLILPPNWTSGEPVKVITGKDGLANTAIRDLAVDAAGNVWALTDKALSMVTPSFAIKNFARNYGMSDYYWYMDLTKDGHLLLGHRKGYLNLALDSLVHADIIQKPSIMGFKVFDKLKLFQDNETIRLSWKENFFSIEYASCDFESGELVEYSYMLEGLESNWNLVGPRRYASFTQIRGGSYTFKVRARKPGLSWSEPTSIKIVVVPPFWRTSWFWCGIALLGIFMLWLAYKYRERQIRKEEQLKASFERELATVKMTALRAQMNPHFLFNCLNSIKLFIIENDTERANKYLTRFSRLIRLILQHSNEPLVSLEDELEALKLYIDLEAMRFGHKFEYRMDIDQAVKTDSVKIPPLIIQPFVENAIWHGLMHKSGDGLLQIQIHQDAEQVLHIKILDNGIGREAAEQLKSKTSTKSKSFGMDITQDRLKLNKELYGYEAQVRINDLKDSQGQALGTEVLISITNVSR